MSAKPFLAPWVELKYSNTDKPSLKFAIIGVSMISPEGFELMKNSLSEKFGEACYMSCGLMSTKKEAIVHIKATIGKLTESDYSIFIYLFRYFLILLIGFLPLLILIKNSIIKITIFKFKKLTPKTFKSMVAIKFKLTVRGYKMKTKSLIKGAIFNA